MPDSPQATTRDAREVIENHLRLSNEGKLDEDLQRNFAPDVVALTGRGVFRGHDGMRALAEQLMHEVPGAHFEYHTHLVEGDVGFLEWTCHAGARHVPDGADSYVVRDGRIVTQTIHYTVMEGERIVGGL